MMDPFSLTAKQEEQHLLARARAGNGEAFEKLVEPHRNSLLRVTQRILRNREDAEDTAQTALFNAWRNLDLFQGRSRFSSWLTRIAVNAALMRLRANRCKNEVSFDEVATTQSAPKLQLAVAVPGPEHEVAAKELLRLIESRLRHLEPHYVEILKLSVVEEMTGKEAARILGVPVTTVKSRLYRARGILSRNVQPIMGKRRRRANIAYTGASVPASRTLTSA